MKIGLQLKANLENVTDVLPSGDDFRWYIKVKCTNCGETTDKWQYVTMTEKVPLKSGRGEASMVIKCKMCSRENSLDLLEGTVKPYTAEDSDTFKTIVAFECRGTEPVDFSPRIGWTAKGVESGTTFNDVSLVEKEWVDYDEKSKESVGIYEVEHKFLKLSK